MGRSDAANAARRESGEAKQTGGLRVTRVACPRHDASEGMQKPIPTVEAFGRWYDHGIAWWLKARFFYNHDGLRFINVPATPR